MGTLTGDTPSLPEHCDHKLPTSCRLTASAKCCACQDVRPHTDLYTTYVDGVGLVQRGTRWQRYCYFCREFWENRVAATDPPMRPRDTRIPEIPNQTPFIEKWFEYHRGYRLVRRGNSEREEEEEVVFEKPWRDADPGTLPVLNHAERRMPLRTAPLPAQQVPNQDVSLDATLDQLLATADEDNDGRPETSAQVTSVNQENTAIGPVAELEPDPDEEALGEARERLQEAEHRYRSAQLRRQRATCEMTASEAELNIRGAHQTQAQRDLRQIQSRQEQRQAQALVRMMQSQEEISQRAAQRFARVFGTREEIERQGADYVSPLTSMFTRAYERYNVAEEVRAEERASTQNSARHNEMITGLAQQRYPQLFQAIQQRVEHDIAAEESMRTLDDAQDQRPPPKTEEQMTLKLACKVCLQQTADTAVLPCGHLVMCSYCADIVVPVRPNDHTSPIGKAQCPMCRKQVKRRARIFTS